ncbi:hypothetical protein [Streptomyces sp. NPDC126933]|uniref:hypothetical protein n=1 Tax=unclassified Streptomyces TaxID=2593676 RepID=UPI00365C00CF
MARKTITPRTASKTAPARPAACEVCKGSGQVSVTVRVGRRHRPVGEQDGFCLACFGTGTAAGNS